MLVFKKMIHFIHIYIHVVYFNTDSVPENKKIIWLTAIGTRQNHLKQTY